MDDNESILPFLVDKADEWSVEIQKICIMFIIFRKIV
jgi:hypothetical protein